MHGWAGGNTMKRRSKPNQELVHRASSSSTSLYLDSTPFFFIPDATTSECVIGSLETTRNCTVAFQLERNKSCNKTCSFNYARPWLLVSAAAAVLSRESEGVECGRMFLEISTTKVLAAYLARRAGPKTGLGRAGRDPITRE